jgi:hypothetical protein
MNKIIVALKNTWNCRCPGRVGVVNLDIGGSTAAGFYLY